MIPRCLSLKILLFTAALGLTSCNIKKLDVVELREENFESDLELLTYTQQPVFQKPLKLSEIIQIAFIYNLEIYSQQYEREAQARISNAQQLQMLPPLTLDSFYDVRSRNTGAFTKLIDIPPNLPNPPIAKSLFPQISSIETTYQDDIRLTANLIDTALAYFRAKEEKDRTRIIEQQHLRARQKLVLDITEAYWKAIAAKHTLDEMDEVIELSDAFQKVLQNQIDKRNISELYGLQIASRLLDQEMQLEATRYLYESAMTQLSGLMGFLPGTTFELDMDVPCTNEITFDDLEDIEEEALRSRPELYIKDLEEKITLEKINESIVPMLPNISIFRDSNYDANPFLVHKYWWSLGMRASWNLFLIPQKMQEKRAAESQQEFTLASRLALSIGVMAQVNLAYLNYRDAFNQYQTALKSLDVRSRLAEISEKIRKTGEFHSIDVLNFRTDSLLARITSWRAYSFLKLAEEQLNYAIGRPFYLSDVRKEIEEEAQNFLLKSENYE